jgi:HEAT repeat protein
MAPDDFGGIPGGEGFTSENTALLAKLEDRSLETEERLLAIKLAGDLMRLDDGLAEALVEIVRSDEEPAEVRSQAAIALGPVLEEGFTMGFDFEDDVAISEELFERLRRELRRVVETQGQPAEVRRSALEASVRAPAPWQEQRVRSALESGDPLWRMTGIFSAGFVDGFEVPILEALGDDDPRIRREALLAAGRQGLEQAYRSIREAARSDEGDRELRLAAIEALAEYTSEDAYETLIELSGSEDDEIAEIAEHGLSFMVAAPGSGLEDDFDLGIDDDAER